MRKIFIVIFTFTAIIISPDIHCQNFENITVESGINHAHISSDRLGGGIAIFDLDSDGHQDMYFTGGIDMDKLYRNNGDGTFTDITEEAGLEITESRRTMSVSTGDIDNDGDRDIVVGTSKNYRPFIFRNNGDLTFTDITESAGIADSSINMTITMLDINLDGLLDIYVGNYVRTFNQELVDTVSQEVIGFDLFCYENDLYINNGDLTFTEMAADYGVDHEGCALAAISTDINLDDIPDIYIANDFGEWIIPNIYFENSYPANHFEELSAEKALNTEMYGMGIAAGDYDRDGLLDYYVTNIGANSLLSRQSSADVFDDVAAETGVLNDFEDTTLTVSWGTVFFDYDHDGFEDLFVCNGFIPAASFLDTTEDDPNKLYNNNGDGTFSDVSDQEGMADTRISRGVAVGDIDNDGDLDLVYSNVKQFIQSDGGIEIMKNNPDPANNWLKLQFEGTINNRDGFGVKAYVYAGGIIWVEEIYGGSSHVSQKESIAHFGLGNNSAIDSLVVIWPGGGKQEFTGVETNSFYLIRENDNKAYILGCTDTSAENFHPEAEVNSGCRYSEITGIF